MNGHSRILCAGLLVSAVACGCRKDEPPPAAEVPKYATKSYTLPAAAEGTTRLRFRDVTRSAGIDFEHYTGAFGQKYMPETLGSGCAFTDLTGDGRPDILLLTAMDWPGHIQRDKQPTIKLYRNRGDGTFEDITAAAGLEISAYMIGCAVADYDGDGDADIFITTVGDNLLLRNDDGRFVNVAAESGVAHSRRSADDKPEFSTGAAWMDYDRDGRLDLFVCNYVQWTPETDIFTTMDGKNKSYATPQQYDGQTCRLYRNVDGSRFEDVTERAGVLNARGKSLGVAIADFEDDGWPDIVVTNDTQPNFLYRNRGDGTFENVAELAGIAYDEAGLARAGMGVDVADIGNDGRLGIAIGNFSGEPISLYCQIGSGYFQDMAGKTRIARSSLLPLTFGLFFADLNLDGFVDMMAVNGHLDPDIQAVNQNLTFAQPPLLFENTRRGEFADVSAEVGEDFGVPVVGRGLAYADYDGDGDLDVLMTVNGGPARLLRNDMIGANWLRVRVVGKSARSEALGAVVTARCGALVQKRMVRTGSSYASQSESVVTFGLGSAEQVERLEVVWPSGERMTYVDVPANRLIEARPDEFPYREVAAR